MKFYSIHKKYFSVISKKQFDFFKENGYVKLEQVFTPQKIENLREEMMKIISNVDRKEIKDKFKADMNFMSNYFLESGDKIRFFLEDNCFDENGEFKYPMHECINKVGHGIHDCNSAFQAFSYSSEIQQILKTLGYIKPSIVQSMYILKSKRIGGEVTPHTDNTYIRSNPLSCTGIWIAFDDADSSNGGMWGVPKSHLKQTDYFMHMINKNGIKQTVYNKEKPKYNLEGSVELNAKKGDVLLLHGDFVHYSYANSSLNRRHAYTLHCVETFNTKWEEDNWLLRPNNNPFKVINF